MSSSIRNWRPSFVWLPVSSGQLATLATVRRVEDVTCNVLAFLMSLLYDLGPNTLPELSLVTGVVALPNSAPRTASLVLVINFVKAAI